MQGERKSIYLTDGTAPMLRLLCLKVVTRNRDGELKTQSASSMLQNLVRKKFVEEFPELAAQIESEALAGGEALAKATWNLHETGEMTDDYLAAHIETAMVACTNRLVKEEIERWKGAIGAPPPMDDAE